MLQPPPRLPPLRRAKALGDWLNWARDYMVALAAAGSQRERLNRTTVGTSRYFTLSDEASSKPRAYVLTDQNNADHFVCRAITRHAPTAVDDTQRFDLGTQEVLIAKPDLLRTNPYDAQTFAVEVELWDGTTLTSEERLYRCDYRSATLRIKYNVTDWDEDPETLTDQPNETQAILPRYIPAVIVDDEITNIAPDIIWAVEADDLPVTVEGTRLTLLALSDGRAWAKVV
jgi:hypothetical protein